MFQEQICLEFHCHTCASADSLTSPSALLEAARRQGIDRLVITDHNTIAGALEAYRLDPQRVIIGEEILTTAGELLAAFVQEEIPPGLTPQEAIRRLRAQNAFISVSHPFDTLRRGGWALPDLLEIAPLVDAIEIFNSRCLLPQFNRQAQAFARQHHLPGTAGSDAHTLSELGLSRMHIPPFENADELRRVIRQARFQMKYASPLVHFASRYASFRKRAKSDT